MTVAPGHPPVAVAGLDDALAVLRRAGHRVTSARRLVLQALLAADAPVSAERIAGGLDGRLAELDVASAYRNLELLEALGLVFHVHVGHGAGLYALAGGQEREYLVCEGCGELRTVSAGELDPVRAQIRRRFGYEARFGHFPLVGRCAACADDGHPSPR